MRIRNVHGAPRPGRRATGIEPVAAMARATRKGQGQPAPGPGGQ
ncbi:MAG: hypothetical protein U1E95_09815 [Rubrivivax sp.]|nr:hypothetical protein [Rubrivivax sp.]